MSIIYVTNNEEVFIMASPTSQTTVVVSAETSQILAGHPSPIPLKSEATDKATEVGQKTLNKQNSNGAEGKSNCCKRFWKCIKEIAIKILRILLFCFPCLFKKTPKAILENPIVTPPTPPTPTPPSPGTPTTPPVVTAPGPEQPVTHPTPTVPADPVVSQPPLPLPLPPASPPAPVPPTPVTIPAPSIPPTPKVAPTAKDLEYCAEFMTRVTILQDTMAALSSPGAWSNWTSNIAKIGPFFQELQDIKTWFELYDVSTHGKLTDAKQRFDKVETMFKGFVTAKAQDILSMIDLMKNIEGDEKSSHISNLPMMKNDSIRLALPIITFMVDNGIEVAKAKEAQSYIQRFLPLVVATPLIGAEGILGLSSTTENVTLGIRNKLANGLTANLCYVIANVQVLMRNKTFLKAIHQQRVPKLDTLERITLEAMHGVLLNIEKFRKENSFEGISRATDQLRIAMFREKAFQDYSENITHQRDAAFLTKLLMEIAGIGFNLQKYRLHQKVDGGFDLGEPMKPEASYGFNIPCIETGNAVDLCLQKRIDVANVISRWDRQDCWLRDYITAPPEVLVMHMLRFQHVDPRLEQTRLYNELKAVLPSLGTDADIKKMAEGSVGSCIKKIDTHYPLPPASFIVNLRENVDPKVEKGLPINYRLTGCIIHIGATSTSGHYVAVLHDKGKWYRCDDSTVTEQTEEQARAAFASAYLIFGERVPNAKIETKV